MELKIYDKANNLRLTASPNSSSTVTEEIGGECSVSASFTHTAYVPLDVDDYIDLEGVRYKVKSRYRPKQKNTQTYEYSVKFYAPLHDAEDTLMLFQEGGTTSEFSYDGGPREHLQLWIDNMNRRAGGNLWSIGTVITADNKTIDYRNVKCWDAAFGSNGIAATFETEMWADGYVINLCKAERGETVELGYLHGLTNLAQEDNGEVKFFTRLFPLGSTRNIDATKYGYSRLQLPDRSLYVDKNVDLYGVKEETEEAAFSEIYPQYVGTVSSVRTEEKTSEEGRKYTVYYFKDNGMNWNPNDYKIPDLDYMLEFQTGELAGRGTDGSFQTAWHEDTKEWEIINVYPDDTTQIPGGAIVPKPGDQYIPWNFALPQEYITAAEQEYKQAVDDYLATYSFDPNKYTGTTDRNYIEKNGTPLRIGWNVRLLSEQYFGSTGGYKDTRIIKVQRKLNDLCQATITCSDEVGTGWKSSVDNRLNNLQYVLSQKQEQEVIDIIKTTDNKTPSDYNVFSALKAIGMFLRKDVAEQVKYVMTFLKGIVVKGTAKFGNFITGVSGGMIDDEGNMEMESGYFRKRLFVPEIAYNRITYFKGRAVISPGGGCKVKSYIKNDDGSFTVIPDLTEADGLSQFVDDILSAFFTTKNEEGKLTGFAQMQFRVTEADYDAKTFKMVNRPGNNYEPGEEMILAQTGNFTDLDRQTYILFDTLNGNNCITFFDNANTWDPEPAQMKSWLGKKKGMKVQGFDCDNYSAVLQNILMTGLIFQTDTITGQPIRVPLDKGAWEAGPHAYFDRVSHNGSLWLCINPEGTESEPADNNPDWLKQVAEGQRGLQGLQGPKGEQGIQGPAGADGRSSYFHIKYSHLQNPVKPTDISDTPNDYIGTYVDFSEDDSTDPAAYTWARFKGLQGAKGDQGIPGTNGANGQTSYLHIKYSNDGGKSFTANNGETPGAYIGQYVDFTQADSSSVSSYTWTKVKGDKGDKGDTGSAGVGVKSVDVLYYMSTSATSLSGGSWQTTSPEWVNGKYMWSKTKVTYTDETTKETAPVCITGAKGNTGATGNTGAAGKGVKSIVEEYYLSASSSSTTGGSWSTTVPAWQNGKYMWTRSVITYTDNSKTTTNAVCVSGSKGDKGDKGNTGATGPQGPQGPQGTPGQNGTPGASFIPCGAWISGNVPYKKNSAVEFAENAFVALRDTSAPPYAIAKYNNGNYVRTPQGYLLAGTPSTNSLHPDWQRLTNIEPPTLYWLDSSCSSIAYTSTGSMSPSAFTVSCKKNRNGVVGKCAELWLVARKYDGSWRSHAGPVQSASISVPAASGCTQFAVRAYWSSSEANAWSDNYVAEIGIGVAEAGATGATGAFPRDRGPWRSGESYEWSADYRDKVIHPFNGVYYNFLVRTQGSTVTDAPTSANGDDNWEAMNKLVNIATDTLFSDGANVAGFMFSGGVMKSQQSTNGVANMILNGNTGYFHCVNAEITGKFIGNISADSGTIGGFSIGAKSLSNLAADVSLSIGNYNNSSTKLFSVNRGTSAMLQVRHDSGICISAETYGSSDSIAIKALCNASGYGQAIQAYGNVSLLARSTEKTRINGVVVNTRRITSSATINANDDFLIFGNSGNITVTMPSTSASPAGKILYMKRVSGKGAITLSGSFRNPNNSGGASSLVINDDVSRFFVRDDQGYWVQYTCG